MAKGFICVQTKDPTHPDCRQAKIDALIPRELVQCYWKTHPVKVYNLDPAREVLQDPERIYCGVREYNEGGWCYVGKPPRIAKREKVWVPLPPGFLFAVYMNPQYHVYEWRLEKAAEDDPPAPVDWRNRYGGVAWQRSS